MQYVWSYGNTPRALVANRLTTTEVNPAVFQASRLLSRSFSSAGKGTLMNCWTHSLGIYLSIGLVTTYRLIKNALLLFIQSFMLVIVRSRYPDMCQTDYRCPCEEQLDNQFLPSLWSRVAPANHTKEMHELFAGAFWNKSFDVWIVLVFLRKTPEFTNKWANFMNFSFLPLKLWRKGTLGSTPGGTPNFPGTLGGTLRGTLRGHFLGIPKKALRKHSPEHFRAIPQKSTRVNGRRDRNSKTISYVTVAAEYSWGELPSWPKLLQNNSSEQLFL